MDGWSGSGAVITCWLLNLPAVPATQTAGSMEQVSLPTYALQMCGQARASL